MNPHIILQLIGTAFILWTIRDSWITLWRTPVYDKKGLRMACVRLCVWSAVGGIALNYWTERLFSI